jgi:fructose-bisphosphate aldolase class II
MPNADIVQQAKKAGVSILAFNIPYLPMMRPVIEAVVHQDSVPMVSVARLEWRKFESRSPAAVRDEFERWKQPGHVWLHLDHIPIIDEDGLQIDALPIIQEAIELADPGLFWVNRFK